MMSVTLPSGVMRMKALGAKLAEVVPGLAAAVDAARCAQSAR
jgi:hypothetical protein